MEGGQAEPPITVRLRLSSREPDFFAYPSSPSQIVGTPIASVTPWASINLTRLSPSSPGPGSTIREPDIAQP